MAASFCCFYNRPGAGSFDHGNLLTAFTPLAILWEDMHGIRTSTLTSRERVRLALEFKEPDRIPIDLDGWATYFTEGAYRNLLQHLGIEEEPRINDWF